MFKKLSLFVLNLILHSLAIGVIAYTFLPIAKWYMGSKPLWGIDFFLSINIASLITQHNVMPFAIWNYSGFCWAFRWCLSDAYLVWKFAKLYIPVRFALGVGLLCLVFEIRQYPSIIFILFNCRNFYLDPSFSISNVYFALLRLFEFFYF